MNIDLLQSELTFKAVKSSGAGGQHVNKVSSKVELQFNVISSQILNDIQKKLLLESIKNKLTKKNILVMLCDESRSQHKNKELVIKRFIALIKTGLIVPKKRVATKIPKAVIKNRLDNKQKQSIKKTSRKKPDLE